MDSSNQPASGRLPTDTTTVVDEAHEKIDQAIGQVHKEGIARLGSQKDRFAGSVGSVAHALRETGWQLRQGDEAPVAEYVDRVADHVEQLARNLRERDVNQLLGDTEGFARRQPALFLGGAFFLGLVAARFLKSSPPSTSRTNGSLITPPMAGTPQGGSETPHLSWQAPTGQRRS